MKYLILGAGPSGLVFANRLMQNGETDFLVLEKENEAGGLCRSVEVNGTPVDIGGGHFIDVRNEKVLNFLFSFMHKEEWNLYIRNSKLDLKGTLINNPIEANIWQLPIQEQVSYLKSIAVAGCNLKQPMPEKFVDWIYWKLGSRIAEDYMLPYNSKMFGDDLDELGTYWLDKLPDVSFEETLLSCLEKKVYGRQPGHTRFYYPKNYGSGELWRRMAEKIEDNILYGVEIKELDIGRLCVNNRYSAQIIINTVPWTEFDSIAGICKKFLGYIRKLKYTSIAVEYFEENIEDNAHWIYYSDKNLPYHRRLLCNNFGNCSKGHWTETNAARLTDIKGKYRYINKYAYPLNTIGKREMMGELLEYFRKHHIWGLGRWGEWEHYNTDVVVNKAMELADYLTA